MKTCSVNTNALLVSLGAGALAAALVSGYADETKAPQATQAAVVHDPFAFAPSMAGTRPDGDLRQQGGALVVDAELLHLFDYYLAAQGEKGLPAIRAEIERALDVRLAPAAATDAKRLLAAYLSYKRALIDVEQGLPAQADLVRAARARLQAMRELRRRFFSASEIAGLFGASDSFDADTLARLEISGDGALSAQQKSTRLAALDQRMPAALREEREAPGRIVRVEQQARLMKEKGAGADEIYRLRAQAFSADAAGRLAQLDVEEERWQARIKAYLAERAKLGTTGDAQQLRDRFFTLEEQRRLVAYEQPGS